MKTWEESCDCGRPGVDRRVVILVPAGPAFHQCKSGRSDASRSGRERSMPHSITDPQGNTVRLKDRFYFCSCTSGNCDISCRSTIA
jgi:hypothetical protein